MDCTVDTVTEGGIAMAGEGCADTDMAHHSGLFQHPTMFDQMQTLNCKYVVTNLVLLS